MDSFRVGDNPGALLGDSSRRQTQWRYPRRNHPHSRLLALRNWRL